MEGRVLASANSRTATTIRGYWEKNIESERRQKMEEARHQKPKRYGFPKWRSTDALSASLVASNSVRIPEDSRIPEQRRRMMEETEKEAVQVKEEIHREWKTPSLTKGKSLDSLVLQSENQPWYDAEKIKSAISRESIANVAASRSFFETNSRMNSRQPSMTSLVGSSYNPKEDNPFSPPTSVVSQSTVTNYSKKPFAAGPKYDPYTQHNTGSPQPIDPVEQQEVLLMLYIKQNLDIVTGLGITIPNELMQEMNDLQALPVELCLSKEEPKKNGHYTKNPSQAAKIQKYVKKSEVLEERKMNIDYSNNGNRYYDNSYYKGYHQ